VTAVRTSRNGTATGQPSSLGTFSQRSDRTRARRSAARQRRRASPTGRSPAALDGALVRRPHTTIMVEPAAVEISCPRPCPAPARPRRSRRCSAPRLRPGGPGGRRNRGGAAVHPPDPHGCRRRADPAVCECRWVLDRSRKELSRARARAPQAGRRNDLLSSGNVEHSLGAVACWTGSRGRELAEEATSLAPARAARAHRRQIAHAPALPGASLIERSGRRTSSSTIPGSALGPVLRSRLVEPVHPIKSTVAGARIVAHPPCQPPG
jgi:hypothetical protein